MMLLRPLLMMPLLVSLFLLRKLLRKLLLLMHPLQASRRARMVEFIRSSGKKIEAILGAAKVRSVTVLLAVTIYRKLKFYARCAVVQRNIGTAKAA